MKNRMFRLMVVCLLASSCTAFSMEDFSAGLGGIAAKKPVEVNSKAVVMPQDSAVMRFVKDFAVPVVTIVGGCHVARTGSDKVRGAGLIAALYGATDLMRNSWNRWHGHVDCTLTTEQMKAVAKADSLVGEIGDLKAKNAVLIAKQRDTATEVSKLKNEIRVSKDHAQRLRVMAGVALSQTFPRPYSEINTEDFSIFKEDPSRWPSSRYPQHAMIRAMQVAQENPEAAAQFAEQMEAVQALLQSKEEY